MVNRPAVKVIKPWNKLIDDIDLPVGTAVWVLGSHLVTLLSPLILIWATGHYWEYLEQVMHAPFWLYMSAVFMMLASAFEIADNSFDRWYLSGLPPSQCDFLFGIGICLSLAFIIFACVGQYVWLVYLAFFMVLIFAALYLIDGMKEIPRAILGISSIFSLYWVIGDPIVFLSLVTTFLTIYFFNILCATLAQSMHGFTAIVNAIGILFIPWTFYNGSQGSPVALMTVITISTFIGVTALLIKPRLMKLAATKRNK